MLGRMNSRERERLDGMDGRKETERKEEGIEGDGQKRREKDEEHGGGGGGVTGDGPKETKQRRKEGV